MDSQPVITNTEAAILDRLIGRERSDLPLEAARYLLSIDFGPDDRERMNELAAKASAGTLTTQEAAEIDNYRQVSHLLALLQSKARRSLQRADPCSL